MEVIPVVNCPDEACAASAFAALRTFLPPGSRVHADVTDGAFAAHPALNDPSAWGRLAPPFALEAHLMVERPEDVADDWLTAGAVRIVVHAETVDAAAMFRLLGLAERHHAEVMVAFAPGTDLGIAERLHARFGERLAAFQVLTVRPGAAGQPFGADAVERVAALRRLAPHATIEVDGGIDPRTAKLVKDAGADTVVSASYIFRSGDPRRAYEELKAI